MWDRQLNKNLFTIGFWLNLAFEYRTNNVRTQQTMSNMINVIDKYVVGNPSF